MGNCLRGNRVFDPVTARRAFFHKPEYNYRRRLPISKKMAGHLGYIHNLPSLAPSTCRDGDIVLVCCLKENRSKFDLHAAVIMPDHSHLIFASARRDDSSAYSLPEIMRAIKGISARRINLLLQRTGSVWREEFCDHVLRSNDSLAEKVDGDVCQNPVRAGLVGSEHEYKWLWKGRIPVI